MKDLLKKSYSEFIARKWEKGNYGALIERLGKRERAGLFHTIADLLIESTDIRQDREFMERVGERVESRVARIEKNKLLEETRPVK